MLFGELTGLPTQSAIPSQIEIIKSRTLAEEVVRTLSYDNRLFDSPKKFNIDISDLKIPLLEPREAFLVEFAGDDGSFTVKKVSLPGILDRILMFLKVKEASAGPADLGAGSVGKPFTSDTGLAFTIRKAADAYPNASFKLLKLKFNSAVQDLQGKIQVAPVRNTNVVKVSVV